MVGRELCVACLLAVLVCAPQNLVAQGIPGFSSFPVAGLLSSSGYGGAVDGLRVSSIARIGYQRLGLNLNFPMPLQFGFDFFDVDVLDAQLRDTDVWVGSLRVDVDHPVGLGLFGEAEWAAQRNVTVWMDEYPSFFAAEPLEWTGNGFEMWELGFGATYAFRPGFAAIAGLKWDHISLELEDPRDQVGGFGVVDIPTGDIQVKMWIPYVGLRVEGPFYRGDLLYSPVLSAKAEVPLRDIFVFGPLHEEADYSFNNIGTFVQADIEADVAAPAGVRLGAWLRGRYVNVRGDADEDVKTDTPIGPLPTISGSATGNFSFYSYAFGLLAELGF